MRRYAAYDPPEYVNWQPDAELLDQYRETIESNPERLRVIDQLGPAQLLAIYEGLLRNRLHDITLNRWVKQGVISKAWLGTGEEASTIGPMHALDRLSSQGGLPVDLVAPMIRNAGACHEMGMSVADMLKGYLGTQDSPTRGRDLHVGNFSRGVLTPISHVGEMIPVAAGIALSFKLNRQPRVVLTWIGDGSTKAGPFHEGMNFAAAQRLPLIVIIQNNQVALGTRLEQYHKGSFLSLASSYGVPGWGFDGNNVLDAYAAVKIAVDQARDARPGAARGPFLLVAETFRLGGHATHDEREARKTLPAELFEYWGKRDPIGLFESYLIQGALDLDSGRRAESYGSFKEGNSRMLSLSEEKVLAEIDQAEREALSSFRDQMPLPESAAVGVFGGEQELVANQAVIGRR
jgi:TPP-dependent pyruvate/acetoin dehydrogenase alpha subunit